MKYDPNRHHRRSIRLKGYDYTASGAYFITICTHHRECLLGTVAVGEMQLSQLGHVVRSHWLKLPNHHLHVELDEFIVMPNHFHGILILIDNPAMSNAIHRDLDVSDAIDTDVRAGLADTFADTIDRFTTKPAPTAGLVYPKRHGIPEIVRGFKTFSARRINQIRKTEGMPVWQRNYYERVIRDDRALHNIQRYIKSNPQSWQQDKLYPKLVSSDSPVD